MTIKEWQKHCHNVEISKGWMQDGQRNPLVIAALFHTEISEFVEDIRAGMIPRDCFCGQSFNTIPPTNNKPYGPAIELADLAIRLLGYCEAENIDLEEMIKIKMKYNETRPYRHGGKTA